MARSNNWEHQIGKRLRLRDLHVLFAVAEQGSMAKAAAALGISQPAVSDVIANLEQSLGVRLLDRGPQGVEPTLYGRAFLKRSFAAFDELKQGIRDLEFLSDPTTGELRIGCLQPVAATLPPLIRRFSQRHPRVIVHVDIVAPAPRPGGAPLMLGPGLSDLRDRKLDLVLGIVPTPLTRDPLGNDLTVEVLSGDAFVVAAGLHSHWARRRKIDLSELVDAPWVVGSHDTLQVVGLEDAFRTHHLPLPKISVVTVSVAFRIDYLINGDFVTVFAKSVADRFLVKVLPVDLPVRPLSFVIVTPKNRTLSPVVERFIECAREVAKSVVADPRAQKARLAPRHVRR